MERVHLVNALVLRKDLRGLYFRDKEGWMPVQVTTRVHLINYIWIYCGMVIGALKQCF